MRQTRIAKALLGGAVAWVVILSLLSSSRNSAKPAVAAADGSKCHVKFVDKSRFSSSNPGQISVRMDILDGAGKPILNLKDTDFEVVEEGLPGRVTAFRGPQSMVMNVVLVIDVSHSMNTDNRIEGAKQSAMAVLDVLKVDRDRLAIIPFSDRYSTLQNLEVISESGRARCRSLIASLRPNGGTQIGPPTLEGLRLYRGPDMDGAKLVMVMTDGEDRQFSSNIELIATLAEEVGAQVHTVGFGTDVGVMAKAALEQVAKRCSGQYQHAPTSAELTRIFNARVQESINECTLTYDSPYPQQDGLRRTAKIQVKSKHGILADGYNYEVGPMLGGRSAPAAWVTTKGNAAPNGGILSTVFPFFLFVVLLAILGAGLALPEIAARSAEPTPATVSGIAPLAGNSPPRTSPPPPPPPLPPPRLPPRPGTVPATPVSGTPAPHSGTAPTAAPPVVTPPVKPPHSPVATKPTAVPLPPPPPIKKS